MPEKKESTPTPVIQRGEVDGLVHYGFEQDGVFHSFASERQGDFDERVRDAKEESE